MGFAQSSVNHSRRFNARVHHAVIFQRFWFQVELFDQVPVDGTTLTDFSIVGVGEDWQLSHVGFWGCGSPFRGSGVGEGTV